jgi:hypothetical protein
VNAFITDVAEKVCPKVSVPLRLAMSQEWLAEKLAMKSAANVSQQTRRRARKKALAVVPDSLRLFLHEACASQP